MKILVAIKQVPDTEANVKINQIDQCIDFNDAKLITNPYDEYALEEALRIKEFNNAEITAVSIGTDKSKTILQNALALGVDYATLIKTNKKYDSMAIAHLLASFASDKKFDLIILGNKGYGDDNSCIGPALAELLNIPQVTMVTNFKINNDIFIAKREGDFGTEILEGKLPLVVTAQRGLNEPRYASLKGIMAAKKKVITEVILPDVEITTEITQLSVPESKSACKMIDGDIDNQATEILNILNSELKIF